MAKNWLPIAAISLVGLGMLSLAKQGQAAQFLSGRIASVKVDKIGLLNSSFNVTAIVINPSGTDIAFDSLNAKLYLEGSEIASVLISGAGKNIVLKKYSETPLTFPINMSNGALVTKLYKLVTQTPASLNISAQGLIYSGSIQIPFNTSYAVPVGVKGLSFRKHSRRPIPYIGKPGVKLEFDTVAELEDYFSPFRERQMRVSKN